MRNRILACLSFSTIFPNWPFSSHNCSLDAMIQNPVVWGFHNYWRGAGPVTHWMTCLRRKRRLENRPHMPILVCVHILSPILTPWLKSPCSSKERPASISSGYTVFPSWISMHIGLKVLFSKAQDIVILILHGWDSLLILWCFILVCVKCCNFIISFGRMGSGEQVEST